MLKQNRPHKSAKWIPPEPWNRKKEHAERMIYDCPYCTAQQPKTSLKLEPWQDICLLHQMHIDGCSWVAQQRDPQNYRECERPGCPEILPKEQMLQTEEGEYFCASDWEWRTAR